MFTFTKDTNRFNTNSYKWDIKENELPMWVADMDFEAPTPIIETLEKRVSHKVFGYNIVPDSYFEAYQSWWDRRYHIHFKKEWMMFVTGVVPAISSIVRKVTTVGDNVVIQSPVYNIFYNSILNNGRHVLSSDLVYDGYDYSIDWDDLEEKLSRPTTTLMILCNPHNPIGKIWDEETLERIGQLCEKHHVLVLSDEIHGDITQGDMYVPFARVNDTNKRISMTCVSASKAFNLAGLQGATIIVPDIALRQKVNRGINTDEVAEPNSFVCQAMTTAFNECEEWIENLRCYISNNKNQAREFIENLGLHVIPSNATYLLWIDISSLSQDSVEFVRFLREETGLILSDGEEYGENGKTFVRMNVACSYERMMDGLERLKNGINAYKERL